MAKLIYQCLERLFVNVQRITSGEILKESKGKKKVTKSIHQYIKIVTQETKELKEHKENS